MSSLNVRDLSYLTLCWQCRAIQPEGQMGIWRLSQPIRDEPGASTCPSNFAAEELDSTNTLRKPVTQIPLTLLRSSVM